MTRLCPDVIPVLFLFFQGSQEKRLRQASGFAEAVGVVPRSGASDVSAVEGGHRATRQNGPRRAKRYRHIQLQLCDLHRTMNS